MRVCGSVLFHQYQYQTNTNDVSTKKDFLMHSDYVHHSLSITFEYHVFVSAHDMVWYYIDHAHAYASLNKHKTHTRTFSCTRQDEMV